MHDLVELIVSMINKDSTRQHIDIPKDGHLRVPWCLAKLCINKDEQPWHEDKHLTKDYDQAHQENEFSIMRPLTFQSAELNELWRHRVNQLSKQTMELGTKRRVVKWPVCHVRVLSVSVPLAHIQVPRDLEPSPMTLEVAPLGLALWRL